jgi:hypothetical protein
VYHGTSAHLSGVLHKSLPSVCVFMYMLPAYFLAATNIRNNRRIVGCVVFSAVRVVSKESVVQSIPLALLGTRSRGNEELLEASFSTRSVSYHTMLDD